MKQILRTAAPLIVILLFLASQSFTSRAASTLNWVMRAPMPTYRYALGVAVAGNGKIYAVGGDRNGSIATVEEYDPVANIWTAKSPMPTPRQRLGLAAAPNGKLYAVGGYDSSNGSPLSVIEEYDPTSDTWSSKTSMPTARWGLGLASANGRIYAIGGFGNADEVATVEEYNPITNAWITKASMPTARNSLAAAAASNGKIYAIGGRGGLRTVEEYDPILDVWATKALMPTGRQKLGLAAAPNGKLYAIGGEMPAGFGVQLDSVEEYDPDNDTWAACNHLIVKRESPGVVATSGGELYAMGGIDVSTGPHDSVEAALTAPANQPPTVEANGPYVVTEGASSIVTADGHDPDGDPLTFAWDLDHNGTFETPGQSVTFSSIDFSAPSTHIISVQVTDIGNLTAVDTAIVNVIYNFSGFFQPVDNLPTVNLATAGSAVPVKFSLGGSKGLNVFAAGYPVSQQISCSDGALTNTIEETVTAGGSSLSFDATTGQYQYVWKTEKAWKGTCRTLTVKLIDDTDHYAKFRFK